MTNLAKHFKRLLRANPLAIALVAGGAVVQLAITGVSLFLFRILFDRYISTGDKWGAARAAFGIAAFQIAGSVVALIARRASYAAIRDVVAGYRRELVDTLLAMPREQSTAVDRGQLLHRHVNDTESVGAMSSAVLNTWVASVPVVLLLFAAITWSDWRFTAVLMVSSPLLFAVEYLWRPVVRKAATRQYDAFQGFSQSSFFLVDSLDLIRLQTAETVEQRRQSEQIDRVKNANFDSGWSVAVADFGHGIAGFLTTGAILAWGSWMVASGAITTGALMATYFAMVILHERVRLLLMSYPGLLPGMRSLEELSKVVSQAAAAPPYTGKERASLDNGLVIDNVSFAYPGSAGRRVLDQASMTIEPGRITALLGSNGSGKTTLLHLICGFYRPDSGRLLAGNIPFDKLSMDHLRSQIGAVMQSPMVFAASLLDNIAYGDPNPDEQRAWEAAQIAMADEFIATLPDRLHTQAGDRGSWLSGGQRQRIAIARALYRRPKLLILDEPTNHLDAAATAELARRIRHLPNAPAVLLITHNVELAACADTVYSMSPSGATIPEPVPAAGRL